MIINIFSVALESEKIHISMFLPLPIVPSPRDYYHSALHPTSIFFAAFWNERKTLSEKTTIYFVFQRDLSRESHRELILLQLSWRKCYEVITPHPHHRAWAKIDFFIKTYFYINSCIINRVQKYKIIFDNIFGMGCNVYFTEGISCIYIWVKSYFGLERSILE